MKTNPDDDDKLWLMGHQDYRPAMPAPCCLLVGVAILALSAVFALWLLMACGEPEPTVAESAKVQVEVAQPEDRLIQP